MGNFFASWKTTIFGIGAGGLNMLANGTKWQQVLLSIGLAFLGGLAKDANVSNAPNPVPTAAPVPVTK